jgi:hypothetical protein
MDLGQLGVQLQHAAEVGDLHVDHLVVAVHQREQVRRLDVSMDQTQPCDVAQGHCAFEPDLDDLLQRQQRVGLAEGT